MTYGMSTPGIEVESKSKQNNDTRIVIAGYYGFNNAGDEAILGVMIDQIKNRVPNSVIIVSSGNPIQTEKLYGVNAIDKLDIKKLADEVKRCDLAILGGGGLFQNHNSIDPEDLFLGPGNEIVSYAILPLLAKMYNKPVIYYSQGFGPLFTNESMTFTAFVSSLADVITVRDNASMELLKNLGVPADKVLLSADPALRLKLPPQEHIDKIFLSEGIPLNKDIICISIRWWIDGSVNERLKKALQNALDQFLSLNENYAVLFVPFQIVQGCSDLASSADIIECMNYKNRCFLLKGSYNPAEIAGVISKAKLTLGMRYHSIIFSLISSVPFIAISYAPKVKDIVEELGMSKYSLELEAIDSDSLVKMINDVLSERKSIRASLSISCEAMKKRSDVSSDIVQSYIAGRIPSRSVDIGAIEQTKLLISEIKVLQDVFYILKYQLQESNRSRSDLQSELEVMKALQAETINKFKEQENEALKLGEHLKQLETSLSNKELEVVGLKETVRQRESSISWRFSQGFGKYIRYNSIPTRLLRMILNKIIPAPKSLDSITIENPVNTESISAVTAQPDTLFNPYKRLKMIKPIKVTVIDNDYSNKLNDINVKFSLVIPVKNEGGSLHKLIKDIKNQTLKPDEVVFIDGGSTDSTLNILEDYQKNSPTPYDITLVKPDGGSLATQRNDGIKAARNDLLVLTDAGSIPPNYCLNLIGVIAERPNVDMVCGIYYPTTKDYWNDQFIWHWESANYDEFLPSARSVLIKKQLALRIGGFPEFLDFTGEDTLFDLTYRKYSKEWVINRSAFVYWDVVDGDKKKALKKGLSYGKGDGENGIGDFRFYEMLVARLKNSNVSIDEPVPAALFNGYLEGRKNRVTNLVKKNIIKGNVLILSGVPFTDSGGGQRGTQLALEFMKKGYKVTFCNVYPSYEQEREVYLDIEYPLLELYSFTDFSLDDYLERHIDILEKTFVILEFPHPDFLPIINRIKTIAPNIKIIYDCIDNWDSNLGWIWYTKEKELEIVRDADILIASAGTLEQKLKAMTEKEVLLIPNAVNTRLFDPSKKYDQPADLPIGDRYIVTYIGALWGEWFDWGLLKETAEAMENANFVLIGNIPEGSKGYQELRTLKNVFFLGLKNQFDIPAYLYYTDVCIIPFKYDEKVIKYTNPLKVYEYLAMHKPVVTTYMDELKNIPFVYLSKDKNEFMSNLKNAVHIKVDPKIQKFIYNNSWASRIEDLTNNLKIE